MTATITELREAVAFSTGPKRREVKPWAAPLRSINMAASRFEDHWLDPSRQGPRRLNEGAVPYWKTLPRPVGHPIIEALAKRHPNSRPLALLAHLLQYGTNGLVGLCALVLAVGHVLRGRPEMAGIVLGCHALHVSQAAVLAAPLALIALL